MLIAFVSPLSAYTVPYEAWMSAYVGDKKIGYLSYKIENAEHEGVKGYRIASVLDVRMKVLGVDMAQLVNTVVHTDSKYTPLKEDFSTASGGKVTKIVATFKGDHIDCSISAGSGGSSKTIPIPEGASLVADALLGAMDSSSSIGKEYNVHYFNPLTLSVDAANIKIDRAEKITVGDKEYDALVFVSTTPSGSMITWQQPDGEIIKTQAMMSITMLKSTREEALAGLGEGTSDDFAVLTSVKTNRRIESPRKVKSLDVVLEGIDDPGMLISDTRQMTAGVSETSNAVRFQINAEEFDAAESVDRPVSDARFAEHLAFTNYLDYNTSVVKEQAAEVVGGEKNAYKACSKLRAWIYDSLKTNANIGTPRCASDVLKYKEGVCRDYAVLFGAMARSSGIPAKVVAGLLYTEGGFYYHAWVECFVGEWVQFDATLPTDFVDATHIKLAEGDATAMFRMSRIIGGLKADVREYK